MNYSTTDSVNEAYINTTATFHNPWDKELSTQILSYIVLLHDF